MFNNSDYEEGSILMVGDLYPQETSIYPLDLSPGPISAINNTHYELKKKLARQNNYHTYCNNPQLFASQLEIEFTPEDTQHLNTRLAANHTYNAIFRNSLLCASLALAGVLRNNFILDDGSESDRDPYDGSDTSSSI